MTAMKGIGVVNDPLPVRARVFVPDPLLAVFGPIKLNVYSLLAEAMGAKDATEIRRRPKIAVFSMSLI